jgi:predicted metal-dependent peptidase
MNAQEKMKKAQIKLFGKSPFFSYLSLFLKMKIDNADNPILPEHAGMGVDIKGNLIIKESFVDGLTDEQCQGVLCHEILHLALLHLTRRNNRSPIGWNIATDLVINYTLTREGFTLPNGLIPDYNGKFAIGKQVIDVNNKTAEEVYAELPKMKQEKQYVFIDDGSGSGSGNKKHERFDEHIEGNTQQDEKEKDKDYIGEAEKNTIEKEWLERLNNAYLQSKMRGKTLRGIERYITDLSKAKIDWRVLLQRYIQKNIPSDFTWKMRSKSSFAIGSYLPSLAKENVDVVVAIDTSGSIGQQELTDFLTEIISMAKAYKDRLNMTLLIHDCEIHGDYEVRNGHIEKIKQIKIKGGGGTSHNCVFEWIEEHKREAKVLISFTDGYSDLTKEKLDSNPLAKIFVISKGGNDEQVKDSKSFVIKIEDN